MMRLLKFLLSLFTSMFRTRASLQAEIIALRHQVAVFEKSGLRPQIKPGDRLLWAVIARFWSEWRTVLYFVEPRTVVDWHKEAFPQLLAQVEPVRSGWSTTTFG